jgi:hypothetical protein
MGKSLDPVPWPKAVLDDEAAKAEHLWRERGGKAPVEISNLASSATYPVFEVARDFATDVHAVPSYERCL